MRRRVAAGQAPADVQADTVEAIDHVRGIGNIGAHMEADINVIIDVAVQELIAYGFEWNPIRPWPTSHCWHARCSLVQLGHVVRVAKNRIAADTAQA